MNIQEKSSRYDVLDAIEMDKKCPQCTKKLELTLAQFHHLDICKGLVYKCPYCNAEFYLSDVVFELKRC